MSTITATITGYTRCPNTPDGTPRWTIGTADEAGVPERVMYATNPDGQVGHVVDSQRYPAPARLTLDGNGRITDLEYLEA